MTAYFALSTRPVAHRLILNALAAAASLAAIGAHAATIDYTFIRVPDATETLQTGLNDAGLVVGNWVDVNNITHGYTYLDGVITKLEVPGSTSMLVAGVNNGGTIVGSYSDASFVDHGFVLKDGVYQTLDVPGSAFTVLEAISDNEQITAFASVRGTRSTNYLFHDGRFDAIPGASSSDVPVAVNDAGTVVGFSYVYADGKTTPIRIPDAGNITARGINAAGVVVGYYYDQSTAALRGFVLRDGVVKDFVRAGSPETFAIAINDADVVTGYATDLNGSASKGFAVGLRKGTARFVPVVPGPNTFTNNINRRGQIAGTVGDAAFLGTPTR